MGSARAVALGGIMLLSCSSSDPPEEFLTVIEQTRSACIQGDSVYEGVADGVMSPERARAKLDQAIQRAESANQLLLDTEELIPARNDHDISPAGVAGTLRLMHDRILDGDPFAFSKEHTELRRRCAPLDSPYSKWDEYE